MKATRVDQTANTIYLIFHTTVRNMTSVFGKEHRAAIQSVKKQTRGSIVRHVYTILIFSKNPSFVPLIKKMLKMTNLCVWIFVDDGVVDYAFGSVCISQSR